MEAYIPLLSSALHPLSVALVRGVSNPRSSPFCFSLSLSLSIFFSVIHAAIAGVSPFWRGQLVCRRYRASWRTDSIG